MSGTGDYISREAVEQIIAAQCGECADACLEFDGIQPDCNQCLLHGAAKAIKDIPAADVRPVRRGKWLPIIEENEYGEAYQAGCYCSECNEVLQHEPNFCPNCGADMREKS